jgi:hypothetical protein
MYVVSAPRWVVPVEVSCYDHLGVLVGSGTGLPDGVADCVQCRLEFCPMFDRSQSEWWGGSTKPSPHHSKMPGRSSPITLRAQALTLLEEGNLVTRIMEHTGLSKATIYRIKNTTIEQGYETKVSTELEGRNNHREGRRKKGS